MVRLDINTHRTAFVNFAPRCEMKGATGLEFYLLYVQNMNTKLGGKGGRCVGLTTLAPLCAVCLDILGASTNLLQP